MLYAFGSNGSGQLGVGHSDDLNKPAPVLKGDDQSDWNIKQFAAGGNHTLILCEDGSVRATGNNEDGRCGIKTVRQVSQFTEIRLPRSHSGATLRAKQVAASWSVSTILCDDGRVYVCGYGESGELGLGLEVTNSPALQVIPRFPPPGTEIVHLVSGMAHTIAILSNGEVYGWGLGRKGQLGEPAQISFKPRKVAGLKFLATNAVCGRDFSFIVGKPSSGEVAILGPNGYDRWGIKADAPEKLDDWSSIAAAWCSIYALKASRDFMCWGRDDRGQLPSEGLPEIQAIAAGSEHCLGLSRTGKVLAWGWGEHGNCGEHTDSRGDVKSTFNEIEVPGRVTKIFAGCATSFIVTEEQANGHVSGQVNGAKS